MAGEFAAAKLELAVADGLVLAGAAELEAVSQASTLPARLYAVVSQRTAPLSQSPSIVVAACW